MCDKKLKVSIGTWIKIAAIGIWVMVIILATLSLGCSQVQMSHAYRSELVMTNILVQSLNEDCQGGDPNACEQGLNESARILQLLVNAVQGQGGQQQ